MGRTFCPLGDAAAMPTLGFVKKFRKEFEDHLNGKPCPFAKHVDIGCDLGMRGHHELIRSHYE